jgi:hypothetical protein
VTAIIAAVGAVAWLCFLLLGIGLAQAAARGDETLRRAVAAESRRRVLAAQPKKPVRRAA